MKKELSDTKYRMSKIIEAIPELRDKEQREALYSDLEVLKETNYEGYRLAIETWKRIVLMACQKGLLAANAQGQPAFTCIDSSKIAAQFECEGNCPAGMQAVISELAKGGEIIQYGRFMGGSGLSGWARWFIGGLPLASLILRSAGVDRPSWYVVMPAVESIGSRVLKLIKRRVHFPVTDCLMTVEQFRQEFSSAIDGSDRQAMGAIDAEVVLRWLLDQCKVSVLNQAAGVEAGSIDAGVIKFVAPDAVRAAPVTQTDRDVLKLVGTFNRVKAQVDALQTRSSELDRLVREAVTRKQKAVALHYLKLRKHVDTSVLPPRLSAYHTLSRIVDQVQASASDAEVLSACEVGANALRALSKEHGLTAERVDDILDDLEEALVDQEEIASVLHERTTGLSQTQSINIDDAELERELASLVDEVAQEAKEDTSEEQLPIATNDPRGFTEVVSEVQKDSAEAELVASLEGLKMGSAQSAKTPTKPAVATASTVRLPNSDEASNEVPETEEADGALQALTA